MWAPGISGRVVGLKHVKRYCSELRVEDQAEHSVSVVPTQVTSVGSPDCKRHLFFLKEAHGQTGDADKLVNPKI
jgi:hypothetical protein